MSQFENVFIVKKANIYFDRQATSRSLIFQDGEHRDMRIRVATGMLHQINIF